jgi:hypothetical protein
LILIRRIGEVPQEQNLVWWQVLVGNDGCCGAGCGLEACALGCLCWAAGGLGNAAGWALELLLGFEGFVGLSAF